MNRWEPTYLQALRRDLHRIPERSGRESLTARRVVDEMVLASPDLLLESVGGHGVVARFESGEPGPHLAFRSELDALPIHERTDLPYRSIHDGIMHACGHDGHTAVMVGLAHWVSAHRPPAGSVTVLFQPAEETGEGAARMLEDPRLLALELDRLYGFHNIPGRPLGEVLLREGPFACASTGLRFRFKGESSHAAWPAQGRSPVPLVSAVAARVPGLGEPDPSSDVHAFATTTYIQVGEPAFGTQPGEAEMGVTLRGVSDAAVGEMERQLYEEIGRQAADDGIEWEMQRVEPFPAVVNAPGPVQRIRAAAGRVGRPCIELENAYPWSEDVSHFGTRMEVGFFGVGSGEEQPHLHASRFDFPDGLLGPTRELFTGILLEEWRQSINRK
ncbi:MAG: amidohydrolase [Balneolaceae bacterium]